MSQETVLVVDDDAEIRAFLRDAVLVPAGYRVLMAVDGQDGLNQALLNKPDLVLLDIQMPRLSGLDLLRLLREQNQHIPAIMLTLYGSEETILEAFRLGVKDFLQKPFSIDEVRAAIENALTEERLRREKENLARELALSNRQLRRQIRNWIAINDIAQAITSTLDEPEIFRRVMASVNRILQVEAGSLLLLDQETGELEFTVTLKGDTVHFSSTRLKPNQGIAGWVARQGEPLLVPDVRRDPRFYAHFDQNSGFQTHSILCVPLKAKGQVIGVIEVINKRNGPEHIPFTPGDMELLVTLASWVSVAVENAQLNRATREVAAMNTLKQTVTTIAHYINNQLMIFSLQLDKLEMTGSVGQQFTTGMLASARQCVREISAVVNALNRMETIRTVPYVGTAEMIDIKQELDAQVQVPQIYVRESD